MATKKRSSIPLADTGIDWSKPAGEFVPSAKTEAPAEEAPQDGAMRRYVGDTMASVGRGAVMGVRMLTDVAGADNAVSGGLRSVEDFIGGLQSASAKADQQEIARILKEAEGKGVLDQVVAGFKAFGVAPLQTMAQTAGASLPTIGAALIPGIGPAAVAARFAAPLALGAAQGVGGVKSSIYDEVKQRALQEQRTPAEAEQLAVQAQEYAGANGGQIALGAGLGAWAGKSGLEGAAQRLVHGTGGKAVPGMASRVAMGAVAEGIPEAAQGGQEKYASNIAQANAGFKTDPMAGVVAGATMEGLAGHAMGGAMGIPSPGAAAPVVDPAQAAADAIRATKQPEGGPMTRAANAAIEAQAQAAEAGMPTLPTMTAEQEAAALTAIEQQGGKDAKGLRQFAATAGRAAGPRPTAPGVAQPSMAPDEPSATVSDMPFADRVLTLQEQLGDQATRQALRDEFGDEALSQATYYASIADRPDVQLPNRPRDNMLALAERMVSMALLKKIDRPGLDGTGPAPDQLAGPDGADPLQIELDTGLTGTVRVDSQGNAGPETNADAINTRQAAPTGPADEGQGRRASAVYGDGKRKPAAPLAIEHDDKPTGNMLATKDGLRPETGTDRRAAAAAGVDYRAAQQRDADIGLTPDVRAVQARNALEKAQPGDIQNPKGEPFKHQRAAMTAQKKAKGGTVLQVAGGWVVRPDAKSGLFTTKEPANGQAASVPPAASQAAIQEGADSAGAGTTAQAAPGAAGSTGTAPTPVEADGVAPAPAPRKPKPAVEYVGRVWFDAGGKKRKVLSYGGGNTVTVATIGSESTVTMTPEQVEASIAEATAQREAKRPVAQPAATAPAAAKPESAIDRRNRLKAERAAPAPAPAASQAPVLDSKSEYENRQADAEARERAEAENELDESIQQAQDAGATQAAQQLRDLKDRLGRGEAEPKEALQASDRADKMIRAEVAAAKEKPAPAAPGANTLVTEDAAEKARAIIRAKLRGNTLNSGIDPELLQAGITLAAYHVERGARKFAAYARAMVDDLGDVVKPYLQSWYMAMRSDPTYAAMRADMDKASAVEDLDVDEVLATTDKPEALASKDGATTGPETPAATDTPDTAPQEATNGQGNQPRMGGNDSRGVRAPKGRRGAPAQQPDAQLDFGDMAAGEPGDVAPAADGAADGPTGLRGAGEDVGAAGGSDAGRNARNGRKGAGRARASDAGARGRLPAAAAGTADDAGPVDPETVSPANLGPGDFTIDDPLKVAGGGQVARFEKNKAAIELRNRLMDEGRKPTREEQAVLAGYTGWGSFGQEFFKGTWAKADPKPGWEARDQWLRENLGQKDWEGMRDSIINAHYTDPPTVMAMWDMLRRMGFTGGRTLEPSIGIGNFYGLMPADMTARSTRSGIELDPLTGSMAQMLYPNANVHIKGYQESSTPDGFYDLVIGNWPFSEIGPADRRYNRLAPTLHDYFFLKAIDQTRPGGLIVGITSKGTMDKKGIGARAEMARKAELVAAFRLPSGAFEEYAGTAVVTDIIILRKRDAPLGIIDKEGWIDTRDHATKEGTPVTVNEYYHAHPDHVIGEIDFGHGTTSMRPGLIVHRPADMMAQLKRIVGMVPEGAFKAGAAGKQISYVANHTTDRTNALTKTTKGFFVVLGEHLAPAGEVLRYEVKSPATTAKREAELTALIDIRKLYGALIDAERTGDPEPHRKALRKAYEAFVKANGQLSESFGLGYLRKIDEPFYPSLAGLEVRTEDAKGVVAYRPAAILSASTMRGKVSIDNPTITDAFVLARNDTVNPSLDRIAELAKTTPAAVRASLIESGAGFEMPNGDFAPSDVYLAGNVRQKMREAQAALDAGNKAMERNTQALAKVMPKDIPYYTIETQMGATWVPPSIYSDFVAHMLGLDSAKDVEVTFSGGAWRIDFPSALNGRPQARSGYGSSFVPFKRLARAAIANQTITIKYKDDKGAEHVHEEQTKEVNSKIADMRLKFGEWLWKDPTRRVQLEREYNEVRNSYADAQFDGSFLRFQGMALSLGRGPFNLREHQVNAIWRALVTRKSLNAHEVGTGKTFTMGGIAVESRRYGIAKKPLLFAHNANSKSVATEIQQMYPAAKVLYVDNLSKENVKTRLMQIANDDWDVVVMPHSIISNIGFKKETLMGMAKEEIRDLEIAAEEAAADDNVTIDTAMWDDEEELKKLRSPTAKQLVKTRLRIITTIEKLAQQASKEGAVSFEDLGVDMVLVDEAHEFKKPPIATKMKLKGLQTGVSDKSIAMMFLTKYVRAMNNGGNVHLFTGTPITNTMTEVFHMMRYMMQEEMQASSLADWDGWFGSFAREVNDVELSSTGEYEAVTRLQSFINVPELRRMIGQYMDVVFSDDMPEMLPRSINGKTMADKTLTDDERQELLTGRTEGAQDRPYKKVINESSDMTPAQVAVFEQVQRWSRSFKAMRKKDRREVMLAGRPESPIVHDGIAARASFDVRLVDAIANAGREGSEAMVPHPDSKPARVMKNLLAIYRGDERATQVVFMEQGISKTVTRREGPVGAKRNVTYPAFSTMHDMVERLVAAGIPREQIAMVDGSTSKDKRKEIADAMNTGKVRIVFGSTDSLGVGVNMQKNLRAMHHMDAPWMPGDLEQRNGRGHRQGNQWNTVLEYRYLTDRLDGRRWQVLAIKQRFITAFMKSKGEDRVIEGDAASEDGGDIMSTFAEAAGDPRILLAEKYKKKVEQLQSRERIHTNAVVDALNDVQSAERTADASRRKLESLKRIGTKGKIAAFIEAQLGDGFRAEIDGTEFTSRADLVAFLPGWVKTNLRAGDDKAIGTYGGVELRARWYQWQSSPDLMVVVAGEDIASNGASIGSLDAGLRSARDTIESEQEQYIAKADERARHARTVADEPFHLTGKLSEAKKQLHDVQRDIAANPVAPPYWLRNGAPVDTEVTWDGRPFVVAGHRWSADGYFVLARDAKGFVAIPYMEAMDSQGMALYEEHEFKAPSVANREIKPGAAMLDKDGRKWTVVRTSDQNGIALVLAKNERGEQHELRADSLTFAPEAKPTDETAPEPSTVEVSQAELSAEREQAQMDAWQKETGAITPMFSRTQGQQQPASNRRKAVEALVAQIAARWANAPEVVVVESLDDPRVPEAVRKDEQAQQSKGSTGAPEGFFHGGKVYLVAPQLGGDADVIRVLFHESLGHFGLRGTFGGELAGILDRVAILQAAKVRAKAKQYGLDYDKPSDRRAAAEEVLAEFAQTTPTLGWGQKAIAAVRTWLRVHVPGFRQMALSDDEIVRSYILPARAFVQRGGPAGGPDGGVQFSRSAGTGFAAWFKGSKVVDAQGKPLVVYHGTKEGFDAFDPSRQSERAWYGKGFYFAADPQAAGGIGSKRPDGSLPSYESLEFSASFNGAGFAWQNQQWTLNRPLTAADTRKVLQRLQTKMALRDAREDMGTAQRWRSVMRAAEAGPEALARELEVNGDAWGVLDKIGVARELASSPNVMPVYWSIQNPVIWPNKPGPEHDGIHDPEKGYWIAFRPEQIKSATGNSGAFDPASADIRYSRTVADAVRDFSQAGARNAFLDAVTTHGGTNFWTRTVGTQYHKAQANPTTFGRVFDAVQDYIKDTSVFANKAADNAPSLLPKLDSWLDLKKGGLRYHGAKPADTAKAGEAIFRGTLDKVLYDDDALASQFGLNALQIGLYHEFRAAVDESLTGMAKSEIVRLAGKDGADIRPAILDESSATAAASMMSAYLTEAAQDQPAGAERDRLMALAVTIGKKAARVEQLKREGYAPLMRFGKHTLHVQRKDGSTEFFGMYESVRLANMAARAMRGDEALAGMTFTQGVMSEQGHKLFNGMSLDALELFADSIGQQDNPVYQEYLKLAISNRSAMKRMIERKAIKGYSDDVARVLASFVTSNARMSAGNLHLTDAKKMAEAIPKEVGDLRDDAINLVEYVTNPAEEAAAVRALLFTSFIGGSVASALVNMTQPITMTLPYLTQFGGAAKAGKRLLEAAAAVVSGKAMSPELAEALARAEQDGIVSPQEIHHLQAEAMNTLGKILFLKKAAFVWGSMFSLAEQFNRRVSFVAAYQTAQAEGIANPFGFAEKAVVETQGLYNKGNKANLARGAVGATVMTFKQFSVHYLEFLVRMGKSGPEGRKAVGVALALLLLAAGAGGLPFADDLDDLIDTLGQFMGHDTNSKRWKRQFVAQTLGLGDYAAEGATRGLTALPGMPIDLSLRMGLGNLLPATGLFLRSNTDTGRQLLEVAGAAGGLAANIMDGAKKAAGGDVFGGLMNAMPVAVQNMAKAAQIWDTGEYRNKKGQKVMEADAVDGAMKFIGFQPAAIARESGRINETLRTVQLAKNVEGEIAGRWAQGMADNDQEAVKAAKQELADWNKANPTAPIRITMPQVLQRLKALRSTRADRTLKQAPKELRPLVAETLK